MSIDQVILPALTFLIGWLATSVIYMAKFGDRITRLESSASNAVVDLEAVRGELRRDIRDIKDSIKGIHSDTPPCSFHIDLDKRVVRIEGQIEAHLQQGQ